MRFEKMHGAGNDFVIVDARAEQRDWSKLAAAICDRHFGVGSDGLLLVLPTEGADYAYRMFNPDGSEAEMCGNGIRCFARYLYERGLVDSSVRKLQVDTLIGLLPLELNVVDGKVESVRVGMGEPRLEPQQIPVLVDGAGPILDHPVQVDGHEFNVTCVSMGNPHAVAFLDESVNDLPLESLGPKMEHHPLFPKRVNFEVVNVLAPDRLRVRVWERGAGLTLACGTGACAVAVAARLKGLIGDRVAIDLPGGTLEVAWPGTGEVLMTGPAEFVFAGEWPEERGYRLDTAER